LYRLPGLAKNSPTLTQTATYYTTGPLAATCQAHPINSASRQIPETTMYRLLKIIILIGISVVCTNNSHPRRKSINSSHTIESINFKVTKTYPHDTESFTEGFLFYNNQLFESTGSPEEFPKTRSVFGIVDLNTGKIDIKVELDRKQLFWRGNSHI
jgi:glutamine cyclotransferase